MDNDLETQRASLWANVVAAAISYGTDHANATAIADEALKAFNERFKPGKPPTTNHIGK